MPRAESTVSLVGGLAISIRLFGGRAVRCPQNSTCASGSVRFARFVPHQSLRLVRPLVLMLWLDLHVSVRFARPHAHESLRLSRTIVGESVHCSL